MLIFVYALLLGGFIIEKTKLPDDAQWLVYTSFYYWGFGALVLNEFEGQPQVIKGLGFADAPGIWECVQDADSPLWLKRLPFFFTYFVGCSWSSAALTYRFVRGAKAWKRE